MDCSPGDKNTLNTMDIKSESGSCSLPCNLGSLLTMNCRTRAEGIAQRIQKKRDDSGALLKCHRSENNSNTATSEVRKLSLDGNLSSKNSELKDLRPIHVVTSEPIIHHKSSKVSNSNDQEQDSDSYYDFGLVTPPEDYMNPGPSRVKESITEEQDNKSEKPESGCVTSVTSPIMFSDDYALAPSNPPSPYDDNLPPEALNSRASEVDLQAVRELLINREMKASGYVQIQKKELMGYHRLSSQDADRSYSSSSSEDIEIKLNLTEEETLYNYSMFPRPAETFGAIFKDKGSVNKKRVKKTKKQRDREERSSISSCNDSSPDSSCISRNRSPNHTKKINHFSKKTRADHQSARANSLEIRKSDPSVQVFKATHSLDKSLHNNEIRNEPFNEKCLSLNTIETSLSDENSQIMNVTLNPFLNYTPDDQNIARDITTQETDANFAHVLEPILNKVTTELNEGIVQNIDQIIKKLKKDDSAIGEKLAEYKKPLIEKENQMYAEENIIKVHNHKTFESGGITSRETCSAGEECQKNQTGSHECSLCVQEVPFISFTTSSFRDIPDESCNSKKFDSETLDKTNTEINTRTETTGMGSVVGGQIKDERSCEMGSEMTSESGRNLQFSSTNPFASENNPLVDKLTINNDETSDFVNSAQSSLNHSAVGSELKLEERDIGDSGFYNESQYNSNAKARFMKDITDEFSPLNNFNPFFDSSITPSSSPKKSDEEIFINKSEENLSDLENKETFQNDKNKNSDDHQIDNPSALIDLSVNSHSPHVNTTKPEDNNVCNKRIFDIVIDDSSFVNETNILKELAGEIENQTKMQNPDLNITEDEIIIAIEEPGALCLIQKSNSSDTLIKSTIDLSPALPEEKQEMESDEEIETLAQEEVNENDDDEESDEEIILHGKFENFAKYSEKFCKLSDDQDDLPIVENQVFNFKEPAEGMKEEVSEENKEISETDLASELDRLRITPPTIKTPDEDLERSPEEREDDPDQMRIKRSSSLRCGKTPPGTPGRKKIVRFADALGLDLAAIRTFLDGVPNIPPTAFSDLKIDDDEGNYSKSSSGVPSYASYQAAASAAAKVLQNQARRMLLPMFTQPSVLPDFFDKLRSQKVLLENVAVGSDLSVRGIVRVVNEDFHKRVFIRYTFDHWKNYHEASATYIDGSNDGCTDKFSFLLWGSFLQSNEALIFCVKYSVGGQEYWDNNRGGNYVLQCYAANPPSLPAENQATAPKYAPYQSKGISQKNYSNNFNTFQDTPATPTEPWSHGFF